MLMEFWRLLKAAIDGWWTDRAMSLGAGMLFTYFLFGKVRQHYVSIFFMLAAFYAICFTVMCLLVKEGEYPPPPPPVPGGGFARFFRAVAAYFRECLIKPYYLWLFLSFLLAHMAFQEVKALGGDGITTPTARTPEQTEIGLFWGYDGHPGLGTPPRLYNQIARVIAAERGNTEVQNARYFALINLAMADAGISAWETKYVFTDSARRLESARLYGLIGLWIQEHFPARMHRLFEASSQDSTSGSIASW